MDIAAALSSLNPAAAISRGDKNLIRALWDRMSGVPGGRAVFSRMIGLMAPYTSTIGGSVEVLRQGYAEVLLPDRRAVRNHLDCVHAVALVNLAELTGNIALGYSLPDDARFIVAGISIEYLKKARGDIRGICECPRIEDSSKREYEVKVSMVNRQGEEVARSTLRTLVGPKKG